MDSLPHSTGILIIQNWLALVNKTPRYQFLWLCLLPSTKSQGKGLFQLIYTLGIGLYLGFGEFHLNVWEGLLGRKVATFCNPNQRESRVLATTAYRGDGGAWVVLKFEKLPILPTFSCFPSGWARNILTGKINVITVIYMPVQHSSNNHVAEKWLRYC